MAAAASTSLCSNLLSFLAISKSEPPPPPPHLHLSPKTQKHVFVSLVASSSSSSESERVINPALAHANTLLFKSAYNVQVIVHDGESEERLVNRFRREMMRAGVIQEVKRRRYFENSQDERKRRTRDAAKRNKRRRTFAKPPVRQGQDVPVPKKSDDDEDNWDLPQGDIPF